jgi:hypothetical protein
MLHFGQNFRFEIAFNPKVISEGELHHISEILHEEFMYFCHIRGIDMVSATVTRMNQAIPAPVPSGNPKFLTSFIPAAKSLDIEISQKPAENITPSTF